MSERFWPEELVLEICLRLPAKSIGKFRCVSKFWCKALTDSKFVKNHLNQSKLSYKEQILITTKFEKQLDLYLVSCYNDQAIEKLGVELHQPVPTSETKFVYVLGCCDGIICLIYPVIKMIYLWNPCIGEFKKLPNSLSRNSNGEDWVDIWVLVTFGFGYNSVVDDYEIVRVEDVNFSSSLAYVYSLKKNIYRQVQDIPYMIHHINKSGKLVNGALHWVGAPSASGSTRSWVEADYKLIIAYDIGGERFREVPRPDYEEEGLSRMKLADFRDQLCLCCWYEERIDFWVMKEYNVRGSWVKLFDVNITPCCGNHLPLHYTRNGSILLFMGKDLGLHDQKTKSQVRLMIGGNKKVINATTFIESLVRLNVKGQH